MLNQAARSFTRKCHPVGTSIGAIAGLLLLSLPARAQEDHEEHLKVIKRPVVVVRSANEPVHAWSVQGSRAFLGVQTVELTPELRLHFGVPEETGIMISRITPESPAELCGIQVGDILTAVDNDPITSSSELMMTIGRHETETSANLEIWRHGKVQTLEATLVEHEGPWVDIRQFHLGADHVGLHEMPEGGFEDAIEIETETLNMAIEKLNQTMSTPEWHERVYRFKEHQGDLMERIDTLERRLKELELELERLPPED